MNGKEWMKSGVFVAVALLLVFLTVATMPKTETVKDVDTGILFEEFDPTKAASLEVVRVNEDSNDLEEFKVERNRFGWTIPSHGGYPADAEKQMTDAATLLVGMEIAGIATDDSSLHIEYGVVAPSEKKVREGAVGLGSSIRVADSKGKDLASLIVGKKVKGEDQQHYVRIPKQDVVYRATFDLDKLSTKFEDWIEQDLLDLNSFDVDQVTIKDYQMQRIAQTNKMQRIPRMDATVKEDGTDWKVEKLVYYSQTTDPKQPFEPNEGSLSELEELDEEKLDDLKSALGDVEIVNVERKPKSLGADLKAGEGFADDQEANLSLASRGFYPFQIGEKEFDLVGDSGEMFATTRDGVQYLLRFGGSAGTEEGTDKLNRYLMVSVQVDESRFTVPEKPAELIEAEAKESEVKSGPPDSEKAQGKEQASQAASGKSADSGDKGKKDEAESADENSSEGAEGEGGKKEEEEEEVDLDEIRKVYERKLEKYKEDREKADEKVRELNARFHDWYYVISEDMYKKMRLSRANLIKESKSAVDKGFNIDSFRKLEKEGLKKEEDEKEDGV